MRSDFYQQFENRYRGSSELVTDRLKFYLPFVSPLLIPNSKAFAIDLGCGRGEWISILNELGFEALGVDVDDQMLAICKAKNLSVVHQDAISALRQLSDKSQTIVSGFHIAEHLTFSDLQILIQEAFRVLKHDGLLILETPNPENIVVGSSIFYLDPTHHRPIHPLLLSFLAEYFGFDRTKIIRLQENVDLTSGYNISIYDILTEVSPDYAVIAQKNRSLIKSDELENAFRSTYGITLKDICSAYEIQNQIINERLNARLSTQDYLITTHTEQLRIIEKILKPFIWLITQKRLLRQQGILKRLNLFYRKIVNWLLIPMVILLQFFRVRKFLVWLFTVCGLYQWIRNKFYSFNINLREKKSELNENEVMSILQNELESTQQIYSQLSIAFSKKTECE